MSGQTEREALVQTIASSLAMSYGSHVNAPKGGRDWKAAENLLGVLEHLGLRRIDLDDEALVEKAARAVAEADYMLPEHASPGTTAWEAAPYLRAEWTVIARAALKAVTS